MCRVAEERNKELSAEDRAKNLEWLVVGRKGEKRMIKGVPRSQPLQRTGVRDEGMRAEGDRGRKRTLGGGQGNKRPRVETGSGTREDEDEMEAATSE